MIRQLFVLSVIFTLSALHGRAQSEDEAAVKQSIQTFFEGFHKKDSNIINSVVREGLVLQTMGVDGEGITRIRTENFQKFLTSIIQIPDSVDFREELHDFHIQVDGPMAHAWTPYTFWIGEKKSHCGVNSFQLFNESDRWMIIYLADTRRREGCGE